jgi:hypothetical protein
MSKRYYTKHSAHGSSTSYGFANDTIVSVWDSKESMQNFLDSCENLSAKRIKRSEVTKYASTWSSYENKILKPNTFKGECWVINNSYEDLSAGLLGQIDIGYINDGVETFYK